MTTREREAEPAEEERQLEPGQAAAPHLTEEEIRQTERRAAIGAHVVHEAIRIEGEEELARPSSALAWSGLAAGLSMGFSLIAEGLLRHHLPDAGWRPLIAELGYSVGFLIVVLGRQQLFTENTLTPIIPLLAQRNLATLVNVLRLWTVVLVSNVAGALAFAWIVRHSVVFDSSAGEVFLQLGREGMEGDFWGLLLGGIFAGWLIALMVWLLPGAETARVPIIVILSYLIGLGQLPHIIAGSVEVFYVVADGSASWGEYLGGYAAPTLIGNIIGGVALVSALNHAQVVAGTRRRERLAGGRRRGGGQGRGRTQAQQAEGRQSDEQTAARASR